MLAERAQKLLDELESWFWDQAIVTPHYVQTQMTELKRELDALND